MSAVTAIDRRAVSTTLLRKGTATFNTSGEPVPGANTTSTIRAVRQPMSGRQLMDLPEGLRSEAKWLLWTRSEVRIDDAVSFGSVDCRVVYLWPREEGGFYRAAMSEIR